MDLDATIQYNNGRALFRIRREAAGIYYAFLLHFDGDRRHAPPGEITLVRGIRQWTGSLDNKTLLNGLGQAVEEHFFPSSNKRNERLR
ncbi:hypothetical protein [Flavisolibacter ginsenosidimutans]|uniref:Uncharacterized protein n=1 Tax=Flavisolibacter ginsenosidimutans TaxID=661481 RepID=A0A5B8UHM9_9BACT|nr:hypothetical protein [Flavisolibacter ginsenosidimutans]QEC56147.1 hypothetical protein FSB75_09660 [Flavisolibacter ginsenosidimutans]